MSEQDQPVLTPHERWVAGNLLEKLIEMVYLEEDDLATTREIIRKLETRPAGGAA